MPKPRPLTPLEARRTLANRLGRVADRVRQFATKLGIRPYRCFLVWTRWGGTERGEGTEREVARLELLPTPKVESLDAVSLRMYAAGILPEGSVRLRYVSVFYTHDQLSGLVIPSRAFLAKNEPPSVNSPAAVPPHPDHVDEPTEFFYEVVEDGRGDDPPLRFKFRLSAAPYRDAGNVHWVLLLERISEDRDRLARSNIGNDQRPLGGG